MTEITVMRITVYGRRRQRGGALQIKGVPEMFVMERSGNRNVRSLQGYERPDIKTKVAVSKSMSKCLDGGLVGLTKKRTILTRRGGY